MAGLLDFLQGASNSAAANVSAPIDGLNWLLRKMGAPVSEKPFLGSDWMVDKGLTAAPQNRNMGLLGEAVGGVLPMVVAAKAPQIAQGLLQAERNLAAPRTLNPQAGAILWHGSPHKFDAFDASKIGTGEGAQAYGHGLYLAESPDVAKSYAENLSANVPNLLTPTKDEYKTIVNLKRMQRRGESLSPEQLKTFTDIAGKISGYETAVKNISKNVYKVDLPDEHIAKMLDWDKPLSQQPENIKSLFSNNVTRQQLNAGGVETMPISFNGKTTYEFSNGFNGQDLYETLANNLGADEAAQLLKQQGVPGMRYLDGGSRGAGAGSSNYVVFPGNEGLLNILERNGKPIK